MFRLATYQYQVIYVRKMECINLKTTAAYLFAVVGAFFHNS